MVQGRRKATFGITTLLLVPSLQSTTTDLGAVQGRGWSVEDDELVLGWEPQCRLRERAGLESGCLKMVSRGSALGVVTVAASAEARRAVHSLALGPAGRREKSQTWREKKKKGLSAV